MKPIFESEIYRTNYKNRILKNTNTSLRLKAREAVKLFIKDKTLKKLADHELKRGMKRLRSFSITREYRIVYVELDDKILFLDIGTHADVYKN